MPRLEPRLKATAYPPNRQMTWVQMEKGALLAISRLAAENLPAAQLMLTIVNQLESNTGGIVVASRQALCELTGFSIRTFHRAVKPLVEQQWVQRVRVGNAFAFAVNTQIAWIGNREKLPHARFTATVIASRSEQDRWGLEPIEHPPIPIGVFGSTESPEGDADQPEEENDDAPAS